MNDARRRFPLRTLVVLAAIALLGSSCASRTHRKTFYEDQTTRIVLVQQKKGGEAIDRGYGHPLQIAPVRLAHVLSRVDVRVEVKDSIQRIPAIQTDALYELADKISAAFAQADPSQHLVVYSIRRAKRFGVFDRRYLTSFLTFVEGDSIYIHLGKVEWEIPKSGRRERLPEPRMTVETDKFRVVASSGMLVATPNTLVVDWRSQVFKKPTRTHIEPGGKVVRRTILMEAPQDDEPAAAEDDADQAPASLSAATLRALADLETERESGDITEADYTTRRRAILAADPASR
jgi:hypothetical protein